MPSIDNDDWSDSDDEVLSEVETSVLLGVPDGPIDDTAASELLDAAVSRIGGKPVRRVSPHTSSSFVITFSLNRISFSAPGLSVAQYPICEQFVQEL